MEFRSKWSDVSTIPVLSDDCGFSCRKMLMGFPALIRALSAAFLLLQVFPQVSAEPRSGSLETWPLLSAFLAGKVLGGEFGWLVL